MSKFDFLWAGFRYKRLITIVYTVQFVLALTIGLQVYQVIDASIGHSVSLEGLTLGNAHMVINDLLNVHGSSLSPLLGQVRWMVLLYLIMAAFIHAGIWYSLISECSKISLWVGGANYFGRTLVIGIVMTIILLIWTALLWMPYLSKIQYWMEYLPSEEPILWIGLGVILVWLFGAVFIFTASGFSKIMLIRDRQSVFKSILKGIKLSIRYTIQLLPVLLLMVFVLGVLYYLHSLVDDWKILTTTFGILVLFIIQQMIVWIKIGLRISVYRYMLDKV